MQLTLTEEETRFVLESVAEILEQLRRGTAVGFNPKIGTDIVNKIADKCDMNNFWLADEILEDL